MAAGDYSFFEESGIFPGGVPSDIEESGGGVELQFPYVGGSDIGGYDPTVQYLQFPECDGSLDPACTGATALPCIDSGPLQVGQSYCPAGSGNSGVNNGGPGLSASAWGKIGQSISQLFQGLGLSGTVGVGTQTGGTAPATAPNQAGVFGSLSFATVLIFGLAAFVLFKKAE